LLAPDNQGSGGNKLWIFTPTNGAANSAWKPTISSITPNNDSVSSYTLTGTQLNGISAGSAYGDDAESDTNYPIVQLVGGGHTYYATTTGWTPGVSPVGDPTVMSVKFTSGAPTGDYQVTVIANGIASDPVQAHIVQSGTNQPGNIVGRVYNDLNHSGVEKASDPGLSNWLVFLDFKGDGVFDPNVDPYQITDSTGHYAFLNVAGGSYKVGEFLLPNYAESDPPPPGEKTVTVNGGNAVADFGDYQVFAQVLIDDADPVNFSANGPNWAPNPNGYNGGSQTHAPTSDPTQNAQWTVTTGKGAFELFATWANDPSFASNATYSVYDGTKLLANIVENQKNPTTQANVDGGIWNKLGRFATSTGTFTIVLDTNGANGTVDADAVFAAPAPATSTEAITNGGFEANGGSFAGWTTVVEPGSYPDSNWYIQSGTSSPVSGFAVPPPPGPTHAAMTDQHGPGSVVLYQDVTIPSDVTGGGLSFDRFIGNRNSVFFTPPTLDFNGSANQQARVDIINTSANVFSVAPSDVLLNVYQTHVGDPNVSGYTPQMTDLTSFLVAHAGQTVRLRFAMVDNQYFFQFGIDDVSLKINEGPSVANGGGGGGFSSPSVAGSADLASAAPIGTGYTTGTSNAPTSVAGYGSTPPSVSSVDNLFMSMGNGSTYTPGAAPVGSSNENVPTITGAAFNAYLTSLPTTTSSSDTLATPGSHKHGHSSSQDEGV
jgi:hypothetical protein